MSRPSAHYIHSADPPKTCPSPGVYSTPHAAPMSTGYPYARPPTSFIFVNGPSSGPAAYTFDNAAWVPPSSWQGSLEALLGLQVTGPQGGAGR